MAKLSLSKLRTKLGSPQGVSDFIQGADGTRAPTGEFPWQAPHVSNRNKRSFNLHMPEDYKLKLQFVAAHNKSEHGFCLEALKDAIDAEVDRLLKEGKIPDGE